MSDTTTAPLNGQAPTAEPTVPLDDGPSRQEAREARVAAERAAEKARYEARRAERKDRAATKRAERKDRRRERLSVFRRPVPADRSWAAWVAGGVLLATVAGFGWNISKRTEPTTVIQNIVPAGQQATATSGASPLADPFAGFGRPVHSMAAVVIGSWDPNGVTVKVATAAGELELGAERATNVANQVRSQTAVDPCKVALFAVDPRQTPTVVAPDATGKTPMGAAPVFDCTPPATTATSAAGTS